MPPQPPPFQRVLVDGVPYWKENATGNLFYYAGSAGQTAPDPANRICLGTESTGLYADWQTRLADTLATYRAAAVPRARA